MRTQNRKTGFKSRLHNILSRFVNFTLLSLDFMFLITTNRMIIITLSTGLLLKWAMPHKCISMMMSHGSSSMTHYLLSNALSSHLPHQSPYSYPWLSIVCSQCRVILLKSISDDSNLWLRILKWLPLHVNKSSPYNGLKTFLFGPMFLSSPTLPPFLSQEPWICALRTWSPLP